MCTGKWSRIRMLHRLMFVTAEVEHLSFTCSKRNLNLTFRQDFKLLLLLSVADPKGHVPVLVQIHSFIFLQFWQKIAKQECIPVECISPALYYRGSLSGWGGGFCPEGSLSKGGLCSWGSLSGSLPPPVNRMTHRCKSITLPQTSFVGGNNRLALSPLRLMSPSGISWYCNRVIF